MININIWEERKVYKAFKGMMIKKKWTVLDCKLLEKTFLS